MNKKLLLACSMLFIVFQAAATVHTVTVGPSSSLSFSPSSFTANVGDTVKWTWSSGTHTTTSTSVPSGAASWDQNINSSATSYTYVITTPGSYSYKCSFHASSGMTGSFSASYVKHTVTVGPSSSLTFSPSSFTGIVGDTVKWSWSSGTHTTTSTTIPSGATTWDQNINSSSTSYTYVIGTSGTFNYKCSFHASSGMTGSFTVSNAPCSGTPTAGTVSASTTSGCSTYTSSLSLSGVSAATGLTYQWQTSTDSTTWSSVSGATNNTYSASVSSTIYYRCTVTCSNSTLSASTPGKKLTFSTAGVWIGGTSTDWSTGSNWPCSTTPGSTTNVTIPSGTANAPTISSGTITIDSLIINSGATLTISGGATLVVTGNLQNDGTVAGAGTLKLGGSTASQSIRDSGTINNLQLSNSFGATISATGKVNIKGTLTLSSGTLTTNGNLVLYSDSSGTGRIGTISSGSISGNVVCQQYIQGGRRAYRFYGHPFTTSIPLSQLTNSIDITGSGGSTHGFTTTSTNNPSCFWYNTTSGDTTHTSDPGVTAFTNTNGAGANAWNQYEGILLFIRGKKGEGLTGASYTPSAVTTSMNGPVNTGTLTETMHKGTKSSFNQLSNPYPSPVNLGSVIYNAKTAGQVTGSAFYVWNPYAATQGAYVVIPIDSSVYNLEANASFQVRAAADGDVLTFHESDKASSGTATLLRKMNDNSVELKVYDNDYTAWDMLYLQFDNSATDKTEDADATKLSNPELNFYSIASDNGQLSIDARPFVPGSVIPLGIKTDVRQSFILKAENVRLPSGEQLFLHDKYLHTYTPLSDGVTYNFAVTDDILSQGDARFELTPVAYALNAGNIAHSKTLQMSVMPNPAKQSVTIAYIAPEEANTTLVICDMNGKVVSSVERGMKQNEAVTLPLTSLAPGMYVVKLISGASSVTRQLVKE